MIRKSALLVALAALLGSGSTARELTLDDCLSKALVRNPKIIEAKEKSLAAYARSSQANASLLPSLTLDASLGKNYMESPAVVLPPSLGGGTFQTSPNEAANILSYSLTAYQPLFLGGKLLQAVGAARAGYDIAKQEEIKAKQDVTYNVTAAYYTVLKTGKQLEIVEESLVSLQRHERQAEIMTAAGLASRADLLRAKAARANLEVVRIEVAGGLALAKLALGAVVGEKLSPLDSLPNFDAVSIGDSPAPTTEVLSLAYERRPDWRAFELGLKVAKDSVFYSYGSYLPNLSLVYTNGRSHSEYAAAGLTYDLGNWRALLVASWNIFNGFATANKISETYANLNAAIAQEAAIRDGIALDVNAAIVGFNSAREKLAASELAEDLSKQAQEYAAVAFRSRTGTNLAFLDAQSAYHQAEIGLWSARFDLAIARSRLSQAVGTNLF